MKLSEIMEVLDLERINEKPLVDDRNVESGYACDLLSQVLAKAETDSIWITIQSHLNIIGVAVMSNISVIVICEGHDVPADVIKKADEEGICLLKSRKNAFELSGKLYERGIR